MLGNTGERAEVFLVHFFSQVRSGKFCLLLFVPPRVGLPAIWLSKLNEMLADIVICGSPPLPTKGVIYAISPPKLKGQGNSF